MTSIICVKRYQYKGLNIAIRTIGPDVIEYLFAYKGSIYTQSYDRTSKQRNKLKIKEVGAATIIVCNAAEFVADEVLRRNTFFYKLGIKGRNQNNNDVIQKKGIGEGTRETEGNRDPLKASEPHDEIGEQGAPRENGQENS